ncbi:MAG: hypothetical protein ACRC7O_03890, partial [Fimbriiglobus sp.]
MHALVLTGMCVVAAAPGDAPKESSYTTDQIRKLASEGDHYTDLLLQALDERAYPAYREILTDPKSKTKELVGVLWAINYSESAAKQSFRPLALQCTLHKEAPVRSAA